MITRATLFFLASVLVFIECGCTSLPRPSSKLDEKEVIGLASQLTYGMPEEDAVRFLEQNGLRKSVAIGDSLGWTDGFDGVSGPASLGLLIEPKHLDPSGAWVNGVLKGAAFQYPNGKDVPIPIRNEPKSVKATRT